MLRFAIPVLLALCVLAIPVRGESEASLLLRGLVPGEVAHAEIRKLVAQLGADEFRDREEASRKLEALPVLPRDLLDAGLQGGDPEIQDRLQRIVVRGAEARARASLEKALTLIVKTEEKGLLPGILRALDQGVPCANPGIAERAALTTATPEDRDLIATMAASGNPLRCRMAAGACEVLGDAGLRIATGLSREADDAIRLRAAMTLGNLGEISGARILATFLDSESSITRIRACMALRGLTDRNFGLDPLGTKAKRREASAKWTTWLDGRDARLSGRAGEISWRRLFNGLDLAGWSAFDAGVPLGEQQQSWDVRDGLLRCLGRKRGGDLRTVEGFSDYILVVRYRAPGPNADSGIGVMLTPAEEKPVPGRGDGGSYLEVQTLPGKGGDLYLIGKFRAEAGGKKITFSQPRKVHLDDGPELWHELRLEVTKGTVVVFLNGTEVNRAGGGPHEPGKILLRDEGFELEFAEIALLELDEEDAAQP